MVEEARAAFLKRLKEKKKEPWKPWWAVVPGYVAPKAIVPEDPFTEGLNRWQKEQEYWAGEAETRQAPAEFTSYDLAMEGLLGERANVGFQTLTTTTVTPSAEQFRQMAEGAQLGVQEAVRNTARSNWFVNFYSMAPGLIATGEISTLQDYIEFTGLSGEGILLPDDLAEAKEAMEYMIPVPGEEEVMEVLEPPIPAPPISLHTLSTQEILKSLTAVTTAQLPPGMTEEELLAIAAEMDLPPEALAEIEDITDLVREFSEAAVSQEEQVRAVLADLEDWEMPGQSLKEKFIFTLLQPAQAIADIIQPYLHHVSFPLAGMAVHTIQRMMSGEQGMEIRYNEIRSTGRDPWHAMGDAWEQYDMPWYYKLPIEILTDPITYTPGLLLSGPGKIALKAGARGLPGASRLGRSMLSLNKGLWTAIDLPFDAGKSIWARIPKSFGQTARVELNAFQDTMQAAVTKFSNKPINLVTADDMIQTIEKAVVDFKANPKLAGLGDASIDLGKYLYEFMPMSGDDILLWSKSLGGKLTVEEIGPTTITSVNDVLRDTLMKVGSNAENAKRAAIALMVDDDPKKIATLIKDINRFTARRATNITRAIEIGKTAKISPVLRMTEYLVSRQRAIINATLKSPDASARHMNGIVRWLVNEVDQIERLRWRMAMDRFLVRPMAEAYLGSVAYPIWNAFEGMFVTAMEGIVPRQARQESFQRMVQGLTGVDPRLMEWSAGDIPGMLGTMPGREGAISFLPGKIPEKVGVLKTPKWLAGKDYLEWAGRKWIQFSDVWGTAYRANFVMKKMSNYLAELSLKTSGGDINLAVSRLMGKTPKISKKTLGITEKDLKNDMWMRVTTGSKREVLAAKELWSNTSLMQGEQLKILRRADQLSPQARTLGEQSIARGEAITTPDAVNAYCKQLADQSVADLQAFPLQVADSFEFLADDVARMEIRTADDLMSAFQGYEVMVDTAGGIPHRMMSKIHADADELRKLGKYKQVEQLWRSSRQEMQDAIYKVDLSLESVRAKLLANSGLLKPEQQVAFNTLVERASARDALREATLKADGEILNNFWSIPKAARSPLDYSDLRATREALWLEFRKENAVIGAGEFLQRRSYAELYKDLPKPRLHRVDALSRALSPDDISKVMGCNVDAISTGIVENMAMQDRYFFIQMVKQSADINPNLFKGFTEEKIGRVYDEILQSMHMRPDIDIAQQKILQQVEGIKQEMIALRMTRSLTPQEELALHAWIDKIATGMDNIIGDKGLISTADWNALRQEALGMAHKDYYKAFADYTHQNVIDAAMKTIYPYWTYHMYRWFYLPRVFAHRPGVLSAWGKYYNYSDYGYTHIPGTDLEINPFVGSVFGATFGLARHDFKTYYENLGEMGEALDYSQRFGFFPGVHIMLPIVVSPIFSGRPPELGAALPPIARFGLNLLTASPIPGVKDAADWLYDKVFHENFRDYYTATVLSGMQVEAGGKLVDGQSGVDLWFKMQRGEKLTDEEQKVWDDASTKTGWYNMLRSQFPIFRLREEEMLEAFKQVSKIFEEQLGLTPEMQDYLWRHNLKPTDIVGGLPLDLRMTLDEMWQWRIWFGRGAILMPPHISDLYGMIDKYWDKVRGYQEERITTQTDTDTGFTSPTKTLHFDGREWREEYANNWSAYAARVESIEADPEFADAIEATTPEGQARIAKTLGFSAPTRHPLDEALDLYFSIELVKTTDPVTGEEDWDYIKFWQEREAVRRALTDEQRQDFDKYLRRYSTPMERLFKDITNTYFRGYWAVSRIILDEFDEEQIALIKEFYADGTSLTRKEELREITDPKTGRQLISLYETMSSESRERLREASPHLDYWLYVFGYITKPRTPEARALVDKFDADRSIIIRDYLESPESGM